MSEFKEFIDAAASYIRDAERLERVRDAFREMDRNRARASVSSIAKMIVCFDDYEKLKALIDDE